MEIPLVSTCFIATLCVTFRVFAEVERVFVEVRLCYTIFQLFISNIFAKVEHPSTKSQPSKSPFQLDFQIQNHHLPSLEKRKNNKKLHLYSPQKLTKCSRETTQKRGFVREAVSFFEKTAPFLRAGHLLRFSHRGRVARSGRWPGEGWSGNHFDLVRSEG